MDIKPIAGTETCQDHHLGVTMSGRLRVQMPDGTELEIGPGEVFEIPPGHDAWVVGHEPWVSDLVDGSELTFDDAGIHEVKGLHGARQLYPLATPEPA